MSKILFIGGLTSSGTTIVNEVLLKIGFGYGTGRYGEGQRDPNHPKIMGKDHKLLVSFGKRKEEVRKWVMSYNKDNKWFIEKSPCHFTCFVALQELFPQAHFVVLNRDPYQVIMSAKKRWHHNKDLTEVVNFKCHVLDTMLEFHNFFRKDLKRFRYVKYEDFCVAPVKETMGIMQFLSVGMEDKYKKKIIEVCESLNISSKNNHIIPPMGEETIKSADRLCEAWGYKKLRDR